MSVNKWQIIRAFTPFPKPTSLSSHKYITKKIKKKAKNNLYDDKNCDKSKWEGLLTATARG